MTMSNTHYTTTFVSLRPTAEIRERAEKMALGEFETDPDLYTVDVEVRSPRGNTREVFHFDRPGHLPIGANLGD